MTQPAMIYPVESVSLAGRAMELLRRPEIVTVALLIVAFAVGPLLSPHFLNARNLLDSTSDYMETGLMALAMTLVIISGNIDLSVAANLALTAVVCAKIYAGLHWPTGVIIPAGLAIGTALGLLNGVLITRLRLPSITVTLGTLALYRGVAQVLLGDSSIGRFPEWFVGIQYRRVGGIVPMPLILFLAAAVVFALVLHRTVFGRYVYAIGTNESAARFSGVRTDGVKLAVFAISGLMSGAAAIMMLSHLGSARYSLANGEELAVITAVVLGGTDIFGGRGTIVGTVLALLLLGVLRKAMGLRNISADVQLTVNGTLLVLSVLLSNFTAKVFASRKG
jgi:rhamnose transport system permease protein